MTSRLFAASWLFAACLLQACSSGQSAVSSFAGGTQADVNLSTAGLWNRFSQLRDKPSFKAHVASITAMTWKEYTSNLEASGVHESVTLGGVYVGDFKHVTADTDMSPAHLAAVNAPISRTVSITALSAMTNDQLDKALSSLKKAATSPKSLGKADAESLQQLFIFSLALPGMSHASSLDLTNAGDGQSYTFGSFWSCAAVSMNCPNTNPMVTCPIYVARGYAPSVTATATNTLASVDSLSIDGKNCPNYNPNNNAGANMDQCDKDLKVDSHPIEANSRSGTNPELETAQINNCGLTSTQGYQHDYPVQH